MNIFFLPFLTVPVIVTGFPDSQHRCIDCNSKRLRGGSCAFITFPAASTGLFI